MASVLNTTNLTLREIDQINYEAMIRIAENAPRGTVIKSIHCEFLSDGSLWIKAKTSKGCRKTWMRKEEVISIIGWSYMYRPWTTTNHDLKKEITCESTFPGPWARVFVKINHVFPKLLSSTHVPHMSRGSGEKGHWAVSPVQVSCHFLPSCVLSSTRRRWWSHCPRNCQARKIWGRLNLSQAGEWGERVKSSQAKAEWESTEGDQTMKTVNHLASKFGDTGGKWMFHVWEHHVDSKFSDITRSMLSGGLGPINRWNCWT